MAGFALLLDVALACALVIVTLVVTARMRASAPGRASLEALRRSRRLTLIRAVVAAGSALGVFVLALVLHKVVPELQGVPMFVGPAIGAAVGLAVFSFFPSVSINGDVTYRVVSIRRRTIGELGTRTTRGLLVVSGVVSAVVTIATGLLSAPAPDGRMICTSPFTVCAHSGGPYLFPGWYFSVPVLVALILLAGATLLALKGVGSAAGPAWVELSDADRALRGNSGRVIHLVSSSAFILTSGMMCWTQASAAARPPPFPPSVWGRSSPEPSCSR